MNLGFAFANLGNYEMQVVLLTESQSILERHYPPNHSLILLIKAKLTELSSYIY